jgi:hypothetical protein
MVAHGDRLRGVAEEDEVQGEPHPEHAYNRHGVAHSGTNQADYIRLFPVDSVSDWRTTGEHILRSRAARGTRHIQGRLPERSRTALAFATGSGRAQTRAMCAIACWPGSVKLANDLRNKTGLGPLPDALTPHSLRRTFISLLLAAGEDPPYVMRQVGHGDPKVTLGIYAQVMLRKDGERDRLRILVRGNGVSPDLDPTAARG